MRVERWRRIEELLGAALERDDGERAAFVERACAGEVGLRREVESLLAHEAASAGFIESSAFPLAAELLAEDDLDEEQAHWENRRVGAYRIIREIGRGGMGMVFLAEREAGEFRQQVALKVVRRSLADAELARRFRRERQILATLNHPNIAHLLDGGMSADGEPFLAMEYVEGERINDYCAARDLSVHERLRLFLEVCRGVAYAHRHLVVHRDLKPSNMLVREDGTPKLLDFGIAKLLDAEQSGESTQAVLRAFTLEYASPEQLRGQNVTTASDIYSLGVVLYELLTNTRPYKFRSGSAEEIARFVESQPPRPSAVSTDPARPGTAGGDEGRKAKSDRRRLPGDIDNIVFMALRKEPERRYTSVEQFASDIERYLARRPVLARPNTLSYRAVKFLRRNRIAVTASALVLLTLVAGLGVSLHQYSRARHERIKEEAVNGFLQKMLLSKNPGVKGGGSDTTVKDVLDVAARGLEGEDLSAQPEVKAQLQQIVGQTYLSQGRYEQAEELLHAAYAAQVSLYGEGSPESSETLIPLAQLLLAKADYDGAEQIYRRILPRLRAGSRQDSIKPLLLQSALNDFAVLRRAKGDSNEAEKLLREAVGLRETISAESQSPTRQSETVLVLTLLDQGKFDEAESFARELVTEFRRMPDAETPEMCGALTILGSVLLEKNDFDGALANLREGEALYHKLFSPNFIPTHDNLRLQAQALYLQGLLPEAEKTIDKVLDNYRQNSNPRYINFATALTVKGLILNKGRRTAEAEKILREALKLREENLPKGHFMTALTEGALGECLTAQQKYTDAEPLLLASYDSLVHSQEGDNPRISLAKRRLCELYTASGKPKDFRCKD
ncbi:MAG: protein kinase domain-containing protein [Pyrinomonadaceae bacterium]